MVTRLWTNIITTHIRYKIWTFVLPCPGTYQLVKALSWCCLCILGHVSCVSLLRGGLASPPTSPFPLDVMPDLVFTLDLGLGRAATGSVALPTKGGTVHGAVRAKRVQRHGLKSISIPRPFPAMA